MKRTEAVNILTTITPLILTSIIVAYGTLVTLTGPGWVHVGAFSGDMQYSMDGVTWSTDIDVGVKVAWYARLNITNPGEEIDISITWFLSNSTTQLIKLLPEYYTNCTLHANTWRLVYVTPDGEMTGNYNWGSNHCDKVDDYRVEAHISEKI